MQPVERGQLPYDLSIEDGSVAELADAADLKSAGGKTLRAGSSPAGPIRELSTLSRNRCLFHYAAGKGREV